MNLLKVVPGWTCFSCTGCVGGVGRGNFSDNGIGSGGGHGGKGGLDAIMVVVLRVVFLMEIRSCPVSLVAEVEMRAQLTQVQVVVL